MIHDRAVAATLSALAVPLLSLMAPAAPAADSGDTLRPVQVGAEVDEEDVQSPYRIGGDVQIVTRKEIEERHYTSITDAVRRLPGVQISSPGYRASEYGTTFGEEISINGDSGVLITVDGRRVDNDAASFGGARSKSRVPLNASTNINNVERIEVIKGMGAVAYGAEASGGIINIVTRRGGVDNRTFLDAATGSWGHENFAVSNAGPLFTDSLRYFASANYERSGDTKYRDADTGSDVDFLNTGFRSKAASFAIEQDFGADQNLRASWSWTQERDQYPITAPDYDTMSLYQQSRLPNVSTAPGYRNWFLYDAMLGSYEETKSNDVDLVYTFDKDAGNLSSYVRGYHNQRRYYSRDFAGIFGIQPANLTPAAIATAQTALGTIRHESVDGADLQLAKQLGRHSLISGATWRTSELETLNVRAGTHTFVTRDSWSGYLQDKIMLTQRWTVSPGVRYQNWSTIRRTAANNVVTSRGDTHRTTFGAQSNYTFDLLGDFYVSWGQIHRPRNNADYDSQTTEVLRDEQGENWNVGLSKDLPGGTSVAINYSLLDMSNAIARYSVFDPAAPNTGSPTGLGNFVARSVNATQKKKAFNVSVKQRLGERWTVNASYSAVREDFAAKNFAVNPDDTVNVNALINKFRPPNAYQADVTYERARWSTALETQYYTGNSERYFSARHFLVLRAVLNYDVLDTLRLYVTADNFTNESWENKAAANYLVGAFPQPGRSFTAGLQLRFLTPGL